MSDSDIPSSRIARGARLGGLVAGETARYAGMAAANRRRSSRARQYALERRHLDAADHALAVLGTMKGPAMKLGQLLSVLDLGMLPEDVRPQFQARLAALCDEAPTIPWRKMEPELVRALGGPVARAFAELDTEPIGTASIGQVYRAVSLDGRDVAVKVQYPRIAAAARADLRNLTTLLRIGSSLAPSVDTSSLAAELTARFLEELDYEREAQSTAAMATAYQGHPFIRVPRPVLELCGPTILVTEYVTGRPFDDLIAADAATRDRVGEILNRFYLGSIFRFAYFSGDPHPGNIRLLEDGSVAFLDFGSFQRLDQSQIDLAREVLDAARLGDGAAIVNAMTSHAALAHPEAVRPDEMLALIEDTAGWLLVDGALTMTPRMASVAILSSMSPTSDYQETMRDQQLPVEWALFIRTLFTTSALLGKLNATANWWEQTAEVLFGEPPRTELGRLEARHFLDQDLP